MTTQVKVIAILIALAAILGSYWGTFEYGVSVGELQERDANNQRVADAEKEAKDAELRHKQYKRLAEDTLATVIAEAEQKYLKGLKETKNETDSLINDLRNDNLRLSIELKNPRPTPRTCDAGTDSSTIGVHHGTTRAELSETASGFLISLTGEADERVHQLSACQDTLEGYVEQSKQYNRYILEDYYERWRRYQEQIAP